MKRTAPLAAAFVALTLMAAPAQAQTTELRIGMVAPEGSQWSRVFRAWDTELRQASGGRSGSRWSPEAVTAPKRTSSPTSGRGDSMARG